MGLDHFGRRLSWGLERTRLEQRRKTLTAASRSLGFPELVIRDTAETFSSAPRRPPTSVPFVGRCGVCAATVCTVNHVPFARILADSLRLHHPEIELFVLVIDGTTGNLPSIAGATTLTPAEIGFDDPYLFLKLTAAEACCAGKPFLALHLLERRSFERLVYLDADILLTAPLSALLQRLEESDFVVTPHILSPLPGAERPWERPYIGELAAAGVFNAGLFGTRASPEALAFLAQWRDLVSGAGAFSPQHGLQTEQHAFNWVVAFVERVAVLRDPAYNVAYWNLHERSLRDVVDGGSWEVDGHPLVAFHFSGYSLADPFRLSCYDARHSVLVHGPLARLLESYARQLVAHGALEALSEEYRFDRFPSGERIDARMRDVFRDHELQLRSPADPWTPTGERVYCRALLTAAPATGSLLPPLLLSIYRQRPDLQAAYPRAHVEPLEVIVWFAADGVREYGYEELFGVHRPVIPRPQGLDCLAKERRERPRLFAGLASPLGRERSRLISRFETAGRGELADAVRRLGHEHYAVSPLLLLRQVAKSVNIRAAYPDALFADAPAFAAWIRACGSRGELLPPDIAERFLRAAEGRCLARIYSFLVRQTSMMERWPLALVGEGHLQLAAELLQTLSWNPEYDLDDVVAYLWIMEEAPWRGLPLVLELPVNACRDPSPILAEGQERLLAPILGRDIRFREALASYRRATKSQQSLVATAQIRRHERIPSALAAFRDPRLVSKNGDGKGGTGHLSGINFFGYFKSPIGLGYLSRGLSKALAVSGVAVRERLLTNLAMDDDLEMGDFVVPYEYGFDTNLFASYPHHPERLLEQLPAHVTRGRRNVVYLAWEQSEGHPLWKEVFAPFDQIWALSRFAAAGLETSLGRPVLTVPCPLDPDCLPPVAKKAEFGLDEDRFTVLYVCDANSSLERKNPEAAIAAFAAAFRPQDRATLLLRIANAHRAEHRPRVRRLEQLAMTTGLDVRLLTRPFPRPEILRLISSVDCYLSLHRAEGFGFTCAEAMAYGRPAVATGYSGNLEYMDNESSFLVRYQEAQVMTPEGPFRRGSPWAEPSIAHAAELLRHIYDEPELAAEVGRRGAARVRSLLAPERIGQLAAAALRSGASV